MAGSCLRHSLCEAFQNFGSSCNRQFLRGAQRKAEKLSAGRCKNLAHECFAAKGCLPRPAPAVFPDEHNLLGVALVALFSWSLLCTWGGRHDWPRPIQTPLGWRRLSCRWRTTRGHGGRFPHSQLAGFPFDGVPAAQPPPLAAPVAGSDRPPPLPRCRAPCHRSASSVRKRGGRWSGGAATPCLPYPWTGHGGCPCHCFVCSAAKQRMPPSFRARLPADARPAAPLILAPRLGEPAAAELLPSKQVPAAVLRAVAALLARPLVTEAVAASRRRYAWAALPWRRGLRLPPQLLRRRYGVRGGRQWRWRRAHGCMRGRRLLARAPLTAAVWPAAVWVRAAVHRVPPAAPLVNALEPARAVLRAFPARFARPCVAVAVAASRVGVGCAALARWGRLCMERPCRRQRWLIVDDDPGRGRGGCRNKGWVKGRGPRQRRWRRRQLKHGGPWWRPRWRGKLQWRQRWRGELQRRRERRHGRRRCLRWGANKRSSGALGPAHCWAAAMWIGAIVVCVPPTAPLVDTLKPAGAVLWAVAALLARPRVAVAVPAAGFWLLAGGGGSGTSTTKGGIEEGGGVPGGSGGSGDGGLTPPGGGGGGGGPKLMRPGGGDGLGGDGSSGGEGDTAGLLGGGVGSGGGDGGGGLADGAVLPLYWHSAWLANQRQTTTLAEPPLRCKCRTCTGGAWTGRPPQRRLVVRVVVWSFARKREKLKGSLGCTGSRKARGKLWIQAGQFMCRLRSMGAGGQMGECTQQAGGQLALMREMGSLHSPPSTIAASSVDLE
eukprot:364325-Chlamydomonas_euryale.AAC.5